MNHTTASINSHSCAKKRLAVFLAVTFALTWTIHIVVGIALGTFAHGENSAPLITVPIAISMFFPLVGALVANRACAPEGRIDLCFKPRIRGNVPFYLAAWFIPALITLLGCVVFFAVYPHLFDPTLAGYLDSMNASLETAGASAAGDMPSTEQLASLGPALVAATVAFALTLAPFINMIPAFGEEAGWRGMLFPTLCELMPTRAAVVVSGVIWGLWHAPIIAMGHNYGMDYPGFPWAGILVMIVACTALGVLLCYLRVRTESVWPCALAHGSINAVANIGIVFCAAGQTLAGPSPLGFVAGIPLFALAIVCLAKMPELPEKA